MTTKELVIEKVKAMPTPLLRKLLGFIDTLLENQPSPKNVKEAPKSSPKKKTKNLEGLWKGHGPEITAEDIDEARKEMWGNFPRDDF